MDLINKIEAILFLYGQELEVERLEIRKQGLLSSMTQQFGDMFVSQSVKA